MPAKTDPDKPAPGKKAKALLRWSCAEGAYEFGVDKNQLSKNLRKLGIEPGADGKFSSIQITSAIYGDYQAERARKMREDADMAARQNAAQAHEFASLSKTKQFISEIGSEMRQLIMGLEGVGEDDRIRLCGELSKHFEPANIAKRIAS